MIEAAVLLNVDGVVRPEHLTLGAADVGDTARTPAVSATATAALGAAALRDPARPLPTLREARDAFERAFLEAVLERASGNVTQAAKLAGRNRTDFYDLLGRHGLSPIDFKRD